MNIPDTGAYLLLGLGAVTLIMGFMVGSIYLRYRNLQKDIHLLQTLSEDED